MDLDLIYERIAGTVQAANLGLNCYPAAPDSVTEPAFLPGGEFDIDYAGASGFTQVDMTWRLLVSRADDEASATNLRGYLTDGDRSVRRALEANGLLDGAITDLMVMRVNAGRLYEYAGATYLGSELSIRVLAPSY